MAVRRHGEQKSPAIPCCCCRASLSSQTIAVRWSDPRSGYYGEQTWRASQSRKHAVCAATGRAIRRGDTVFKPTSRGSMQPFNRGEMILVSGVPNDDTSSE
ncbi:DUF3331 domain-containing protein [Paraburkholderia strydomiana]